MTTAPAKRDAVLANAAKKAQARVKRAKKSGRQPSQADLDLLARWEKVKAKVGRPTLERAAAERFETEAALADVENPSTFVPPPSSTTPTSEGIPIPMAPAPDLGAPPDPVASGEGIPTGDPTGSNATASETRSGGAPSAGQTAATNAAGGLALAVMYGHALRGMNAAAKARKCLVTFPDEMIDALEQAAGVVFAPYGDKVKPEMMVLAAPAILGAQIAVHEVKKRAKEKQRQTPSPFAVPVAEQTASHADAVPEAPPAPEVVQADPPARAARTAADFFGGPA